MSKITLAGVTFLLLSICSGTWYFFIKNFDFTISFKNEAAPGVIYHKLADWTYKEVSVTEILKKSPFKKIEQVVKINDSKVLLSWNISTVNDSVTRVELAAENLRSPLKYRFNQLLGKNPLKEKIKAEMLQLKKDLEADSELYKIFIKGEAVSPETTCVCIALENKIHKKALEMMATIDHLSTFVLEHKIKTDGRPRVQVRSWDRETGMINFDFCFPVKEGTEQPSHPSISFKKLASVPSLRAIYYGNYISSHLAWMELLNYAELREIQVKATPLEIFHDNPELGGNPLTWKAEIFLPLKQ